MPSLRLTRLMVAGWMLSITIGCTHASKELECGGIEGPRPQPPVFFTERLEDREDEMFVLRESKAGEPVGLVRLATQSDIGAFRQRRAALRVHEVGDALVVFLPDEAGTQRSGYRGDALVFHEEQLAKVEFTTVSVGQLKTAYGLADRRLWHDLWFLPRVARRDELLLEVLGDGGEGSPEGWTRVRATELAKGCARQ